MSRLLITLIIALLWHLTPVHAYEFKQLNHFFDILENNYAPQINIKQLFSYSEKYLTEIDSKIHLSHNDSQAFLYKEDKLVEIFNLPQDTSFASWKQTFSTILSAGCVHSKAISSSSSILESKILSSIIKQLDKYTHLSPMSTQHLAFEATIKDNILYVKLERFLAGQTESLKQIISQYPSIDGMILDIRDNHGGQFNEALKIADLFLDNTLMAYSQEKNQPLRFYRAHRGDILKGKPLIVLINEQTASSAELVAAALSEQSRATLIGTKTYGKGSIQQKHQLEDKILYLTSGYFYTPSGQKINETGIMPQICTGQGQNCLNSDKKDYTKDITTALQLIKKQLS